MINRAKCKICHSIIESHLPDEVVYCKCGLIAVMDGFAMRTYAKDDNYAEYFLRIDDLGHEISVQYRKEPAEIKGDKSANEEEERLTRNDCVQMLDEMIKSIENLPKHAQLAPINSIDLLSFMLVISNILKRE